MGYGRFKDLKGIMGSGYQGEMEDLPKDPGYGDPAASGNNPVIHFPPPEQWLEENADSQMPARFTKVNDTMEMPKRFSPIQDTMPDRFKPIDDSMPNRFKPLEENNPTVGSEKENTLWGDLNDRAEGTGRQFIDMGTFIPRAVGSWGKGINELLQGGTREEAGAIAHKFMNDTSVQGEYPTNPFVDTVMGEMKRGIQSLNSGSIMRENPLAKKIFDDIAAVAIGYRGAKEVGKDIVEGQSRRIPDGPPELPAPPKSEVPPQQLIPEQQQATATGRQTLLDRYNDNPQAFGVDESGVRNPYNKFGNAIPPNEVSLDDGTSVPTASLKSHATPAELDFPKTDGYIAKILTQDEPRTMGHALYTIRDYANDPYDRQLANILERNPLISERRYEVINSPTLTHYGETSFNTHGVQKVSLFVSVPKTGSTVENAGEGANLAGLTPQVILHEATHVGLVHAVTVGNYALRLRQEGSHPEADLIEQQYPEAVELARGVNEIAQKFKPALKERLGETGLGHWIMKYLGTGGTLYSNMFPGKEYSATSFSPSSRFNANNSHEFIAWALTTPKIRHILRQLYDAPEKQGSDLSQATHANNVLDTTSLQPIKEKQKKLAAKLKGQSLWGQLVDHALKYFGLDTKSRHDRLANRFRAYMDYVGENDSALQMLEKVVIPFLKAAPVDYDPDIMYSAMEKFGQTSGEIHTKEARAYNTLPPRTRQMVEKLVSPWTSYGEMFKDLGNKFYQFDDLSRITGNIYPVMAVKNIANNPIITFTSTKVRTIHGDAHHFEKMFVEAMKPFEDAPKDVQHRIVLALNEANRPEQQDLLRQARALNPQQYAADPLSLLDFELSHYGAHQTDIPLYRQTLEPLFKALLHMDEISMKVGFKRDFKSDVIGYYPRSFGYGKFSVKGIDATGELKFFRRMPTWIEIRKIEEGLRAMGLHTERAVNKDFADFKEHILGLQELDPKATISQIGEATIAAAEEHRRTQEFERSAHGVAGFIGQNLNNPREIELLRQMAYHRISQTVEAYKAARLLDEVLRPTQADLLARHYYPNATQWSFDVIRRELGSDISKISWIDNSLQWVLDKAHVAYLKRTQKVLAADLHPSEPTLNPIVHKELARYSAAFASAYTLAGNVPNLVTNAFTIPLVSLMGGIPDAMMLDGDPVTAVAKATQAHAESLSDFMLLLNTPGLPKPDPELVKYVRLAVNRGLIIANAFNDIPQMRADIEKSTGRKVLDKTLNVPREYFNDVVEEATNLMSMLFYRRLIKDMFPKLSFQENFDLSVDLTKRYTGDYARYNKSLILDKFGDFGKTISNFSIWTGTRVAQGHELTKNAVTGQHLTPLIAVMLASLVTGGIQGMPFVADYDNITQFLSRHDSTKGTQIPPLDSVLKDAGVPYWLRQGIILNSTGLDLSTRGKWSGFTDMGGVTLTMPGKAVDIYDYIYSSISGEYPNTEKSVIGDRYKPSGTSIEQDAAFTRSVPSAVMGAVRQELMTRKLRPDRTNVLSSHGTSMYTQDPKSDWEKSMNLMNFRTTGQAEDQRNFYNSIYKQNKRDHEIKDLKSHAVDQLLKAISSRNEGNKARATKMMADARANLIKLKKASPVEFHDFSGDILRGFEKETDTTEEKLLKKAAKSKDANEIRMLINQVRTIKTTRP